jgi:hypothetical protein
VGTEESGHNLFPLTLLSSLIIHPFSGLSFPSVRPLYAAGGLVSPDRPP